MTAAVSRLVAAPEVEDSVAGAAGEGLGAGGQVHPAEK